MLIADHITKEFSGVKALDDVCLELHEGKVNAVIGENGAGKSTLMKILSGVYTDYGGHIVYNGNIVRFKNTRHAQSLGIAIIHQELNFVPGMSVMENLFLGREITTTWGTLNKEEMSAQTRQLLSDLKTDVDPGTPMSSLRVGQQQLVEIARALSLKADVIIMDEPTSAISESEVNLLFGIIRKLKAEGKTIVYISHKLDELFSIADRYVAMRDGRVIGSGDMSQVDHSTLIQKMVGRQIEVMQRPGSSQRNEQALEVSFPGISFSVNKGEILGIFGLMGAGRTELLEKVFGINTLSANSTIRIDGNVVKIKTPSDAISHGLALVPEDRKVDGLVPDLDVRSNICLTSLKELEEFGLLSARKENQLTCKYVTDLGIRTSSYSLPVKNLSGGNQQKIVLGKWLATRPSVLLLDEPTRGIDVNAKNGIYKLIVQLAQEGMAIVMVSSELPEILSLSDRILTMSGGRLTGEFTRSSATESKVLEAAIPKN
jgi:ribose transport system ATP-binding protein